MKSIILLILLILSTSVHGAATLDDVVLELQTLRAEIQVLRSEFLDTDSDPMKQIVRVKDKLIDIKQDGQDMLLCLQVVMIANCFIFAYLFWFHILKVKDEKDFW